jgi:hypothetical protein
MEILRGSAAGALLFIARTAATAAARASSVEAAPVRLPSDCELFSEGSDASGTAAAAAAAAPRLPID